jgi:hypothetical protein
LNVYSIHDFERDKARKQFFDSFNVLTIKPLIIRDIQLQH